MDKDLLVEACINELEMLKLRERVDSYMYRTVVDVMNKVQRGNPLTGIENQTLYSCLMDNVQGFGETLETTYVPEERANLVDEIEQFALEAGRVWYNGVRGIFRYDTKIMKEACVHEVWRLKTGHGGNDLPHPYVKALQVLRGYDKTYHTKTLVEADFTKWTSAALRAVRHDADVWRKSLLITEDALMQHDFLQAFVEMCRVIGGVGSLGEVKMAG